METLAPVDLDVTAMRRVVEAEGGCIAWGDALRIKADQGFAGTMAQVGSAPYAASVSSGVVLTQAS